MTSVYDVAVLGLGAMGSATVANVALRGAKVLGVEQFSRGHQLGASSGRSRLIRKAYFEHPSYVPLLLRAYDAWRELEELTGVPLLNITGLLLAGTPGDAVIAGADLSARTYGLAVERLEARDIRARFPMFAPLDGEVGLFEADGGYVVPEAATEAYLRVAEDRGAELRFDIPVVSWEPGTNGSFIRIRLADGARVDARRVVICAGPWFSALADTLVMPIRLQRNVQLWFRPRAQTVSIDRCPAFMLSRAEFPARMYGVPDYGYGVKVAFHGYGQMISSAQQLDRTARANDIQPLAASLRSWMPDAVGECVEGKACLYSLSPDEQFVVGLHPDEPQVVLAGGFSGHGFKFASVIGEVLADFALDGGTHYDLTFLSPSRFRR